MSFHLILCFFLMLHVDITSHSLFLERVRTGRQARTSRRAYEIHRSFKSIISILPRLSGQLTGPEGWNIFHMLLYLLSESKRRPCMLASGLQRSATLGAIKYACKRWPDGCLSSSLGSSTHTHAQIVTVDHPVENKLLNVLV